MIILETKSDSRDRHVPTPYIKKNYFSLQITNIGHKPWTDAELYLKYGLTIDEIAFIESMIKPME